jgi:phosphate transport system protein
MNDHILSSYDDELKELRSIVSRMGGLAADQLIGAMEALLEGDAEKALEIRKADKELDKLDLAAEETAIGVFARRAPVANDLREVVCALKITSMIERMGDYAKNIAKRTIAISESTEAAAPPNTLESMAKMAYSMIQDVMDAHAHRDPEAAMTLWLRDEALDNLHNATHEQILSQLSDNPQAASVHSHYLMIAKNLERIGDQTTNVAEQIYYSATGRRLEEARPKHDTTSQT